jgi:hypothetical protein
MNHKHVTLYEKLTILSTGAKRVVVFNHITRLSQELDHKKAPDSQLLARPAVKWVHLDRFSAEEATKELIYKYASDDADSLVKGRYQVLNVCTRHPYQHRQRLQITTTAIRRY